MQQPFNFPIQLAHLTREDGSPDPTPAKLAVLQSRASQSRRGGQKVTLGFIQGKTAVPVFQFRLDQN